MLIYPTLKMTPVQGLIGFGGGATGNLVRGSGGASWLSDETFETASAFGNKGPTDAQFTSAYSSRDWYTAGDYYFYNGILFLKIPATATYNYTIQGAYGGRGDGSNMDISEAGGKPALFSGTITLTKDKWLGIAVGQRGVDGTYVGSSGGGGGGGTFVFYLDSSASTLNNSEVESNSCTALLVAGGGNGANWDSWNTETAAAKLPSTYNSGVGDPISASYYTNAYGRGAFGGSFLYTAYWSTDTSAYTPYTQYSSYNTAYTWRSGAPLLNSSSRITTNSLKGGMDFQAGGISYTNKNYSTSGAGGDGGFGGGGGSLYEGGGGGGYWGGRAYVENQYNSTYAYGSQSMANSTYATVSSEGHGTASLGLRTTKYSQNTTAPNSALQGSFRLYV